MRKFKDPLSRTTLKSRNSNKYNKFERTVPLKDVSVEYNQDPTGWTKKIK
jgi:hypothetical protein